MPEVRRQPLELARRPYLDAMYAGIYARRATLKTVDIALKRVLRGPRNIFT